MWHQVNSGNTEWSHSLIKLRQSEHMTEYCLLHTVLYRRTNVDKGYIMCFKQYWALEHLYESEFNALQSKEPHATSLLCHNADTLVIYEIPQTPNSDCPSYACLSHDLTFPKWAFFTADTLTCHSGKSLRALVMTTTYLREGLLLWNINTPVLSLEPRVKMSAVKNHLPAACLCLKHCPMWTQD